MSVHDVSYHIHLFNQSDAVSTTIWAYLNGFTSHFSRIPSHSLPLYLYLTPFGLLYHLQPHCQAIIVYPFPVEIPYENKIAFQTWVFFFFRLAKLIGIKSDAECTDKSKHDRFIVLTAHIVNPFTVCAFMVYFASNSIFIYLKDNTNKILLRSCTYCHDYCL